MRPDPGRLPRTARSRAATASPVGSRRVEIALALAMSVFGVLFSLQSLPALVGQWAEVSTPWGLAIMVLIYGLIGVAVLAALVRQWVRAVFVITAGAYLVALAFWTQPGVVLPLQKLETPWILVLPGLANGFLTVARRDWIVPTLYALLTSAMLGAIRVTPSGGGVEASRAVLDSLYALAIDIALIVLIVAVRQAARSVDTAQQAALESYAAAQIDTAVEHERVAIDALVHDRVLTTFIVAAKADTPEQETRAARLAATAIAELQCAQARGSEEQPPVPLVELLDQISADAGAITARFVMQASGLRGETVPAPVATALVAAAVQAMVNSVNHAGGDDVARSVRLEATGGRVRLEVADRGGGFDPASVPKERLGVRVSIGERVRAVSGSAIVDSARGAGTRVVLSWPAASADDVDLLLAVEAVVPA